MPASASERARLAEKQAADRKKADAARKGGSAKASEALIANDRKQRAATTPIGRAFRSAFRIGQPAPVRDLRPDPATKGMGRGSGRAAVAPKPAPAPVRTTPLPPARQTRVAAPSVPFGGGGAAARSAIANRNAPTVTVTAKPPVGSLPKGTGRIPPPNLNAPRSAVASAAQKPKRALKGDELSDFLGLSKDSAVRRNIGAKAKK